MTAIDSLLETFEKLLAYASDKAHFEPKEFSRLQKDYTDRYRRLDYADQGEVSSRIQDLREKKVYPK